LPLGPTRVRLVVSDDRLRELFLVGDQDASALCVDRTAHGCFKGRQKCKGCHKTEGRRGIACSVPARHAGVIPAKPRLRTRQSPSSRREREPIESRQFETFLVELSDAFVQRPAALVTPLIDEWLGKLARLIAVDRITLWEISGDGNTIVRRYMHTLPGCEPAPSVVPGRQFSWLMEQNRRGQIIAWSHVPEDVPIEARGELEYGQRIGAKSLLSIPIAAGALLCVLAFTSVRKYRRWSPVVIQRLRLVCSILAGAVVRERTEGALKAFEARNRAIVKALPDLLFVISPEGVYLECHCRDYSELLHSPDQFLGRSLEEVLPSEVAWIFRAGIAQVSHSSGVVEIEYSLMIGEDPREYEARMVRRDDGAIVAIVRNITHRSRAARQLRESEERFRGAFEHSGIGMALVGLDGRWLRSNPETRRILGYSEEELQSGCFQHLTHPDDLEPDLRDFHRALRGEIDHYEMEKRYIHKDGHIVPAFLSVSVVRDEQRRPLYFVSQLQDMTERQKAHLEIERLRIELARFGRAALTGQLTASLAHHLMQPIAAIQSNAQACRRLMQANAPGLEMQQALQDIEVNCGRAADMIGNIRGMLRKEPGERRGLCVNELVHQVVELMRPHLALRRVSLSLRLQDGIGDVFGNPIELQQVVLNLVLNSAEALQSSSGAREVAVETSDRESQVEVIVRDCGPGVDPTMLRRIFEPFFTTKPEGIGMGLTISADIIRSHGGRIWAEPCAEGAGLAVRFILPHKA
jgi:PAS domain S-box-containing protein